MNYKLLFTVATLSLSTLAASDASEARPADNSHMGAEGYFEGYTIFPKTIHNRTYELCSFNALTRQVPFYLDSNSFPYFQACLKDSANKTIFDNAQVFGILLYKQLIYVVLSNNKTYCFYKPNKDDTLINTAPYSSVDPMSKEAGYGCKYINGGDIRTIMGYTSNQALIQEVFTSIRDTGKITPDLIAELNAPVATERAETLAAVASAVAATATSGGASAGAGSGFVTAAPEAVDPRDAEIRRLMSIINALRTENSTLKGAIATLEDRNRKLQEDFSKLMEIINAIKAQNSTLKEAFEMLEDRNRRLQEELSELNKLKDLLAGKKE
jgi:chaperonin cofactor prefoldin